MENQRQNAQPSIDVNEAQQPFRSKTNKGNQKLTRATAKLDPVPSTENKQTNIYIQTDNNKRQTSTALDMWVYQRRESETRTFNIDTFNAEMIPLNGETDGAASFGEK